jgi:nucleolar GTP-binding protein
LGHPDLDTLLADVKQLRIATSRIAKDHASRASNATSAAEAKEILAQGTAELEELYSSPSGAGISLTQLVDLQKELRKIPVVELSTPTLVLVGAPNVGKSSIVRTVSTGTPEVNDYPFTTRGVTIGHVINKSKQVRYQVMDTPGLLDRPAEDRNEMEKLTFASLLHLPTAVIFVVDPSGLSGDQSSLEKQLNVREALRQRFPRRPWLDVISKGDLEIPAPVLASIRERGVERPLHVSVSSGRNVVELKVAIEDLFAQLSDQLDLMRKE